MTEPTQDITLAQATILLSRYGFEMKGYIPQELIDKWMNDDYSAKWIRAAIIEALYQGRYKAFSVEQILKLWERRKQMTCHFTHEFERLICRNLPYSVDSSAQRVSHSPTESSSGIPHCPKPSERKTQRKLFNPPLINQQDIIFQPKTEPQLKTFNETTDLHGEKDENHNQSDSSGESLSANSVLEPYSYNNYSREVNQLSIAKDEEGLPLTDTKVNAQDLKATLTNLDELFTQFFTDTDLQKSSTASNADLDDSYQWREIIPGRAIDEFTPQLDSSELYSKLKAVVRQE